MRFARILLFCVLGLSGLALMLAWLGPAYVQRQGGRDAFAAFASGRLGRDVRIGGPLSLSLLPHPSLVAEKVQIADAGDGLALSARELRLRVSLLALLAGRFGAGDLQLNGADLHLPWPLDGTAWSPPARLHVRLVDSRLLVDGVVLDLPRGDLRHDTRNSAWQAAGQLRLHGTVWGFGAALQRDGALNATFDAAPAEALRLQARVAAGRVSGRVTGQGTDASRLLPGAPHQAWSVRADIVPSQTEQRISQLVLLLGGTTLNGDGTIQAAPSSIALRLHTDSLNLADWSIRDMATPPWPFALTLDASHVLLRGATLTALHVDWATGPYGTVLHKLSAILPGATAFNASGAIGANSFQGPVSIASQNPAPLLDWLRPVAPVLIGALPPGVPGAFDLRAHAAASFNAIGLRDLSGHWDGAAIGGDIGAHFAARPQLHADLQFDTLPLDRWLPDHVAPPHPTLDARLRLAAQQARYRGLDIQALRLDAVTAPDHVQVRSFAAKLNGIALTGAADWGKDGVQGAVLQIQGAAPALAALLPGAEKLPAGLWQGAVDGRIEAAGANDALKTAVSLSIGDLHLHAEPVIDLDKASFSGPVMLRHPSAPRMLTQLGWNNTAPWLGTGSFSVIAQVSGDGAHLALSHFGVSAANLRASGDVALDMQAAPYTITGTVDADTLALPDSLPQALPGNVRAHIQLRAAHIVTGDTALADDFVATLHMDDSRLGLTSARADWGGGTVSGNADLATGGGAPQLHVQAKLARIALPQPVFGTDPDVSGGSMDATATLEGAGPDMATLRDALSGSVDVTLHDTHLIGFDLEGAGLALRRGALAGARRALQSGETQITAAQATLHIQNGRIALQNATFSGPAGKGEVLGAIDLPANSLNLQFGMRPVLGAGSSRITATSPALFCRFSGPVHDPRRMIDLSAFAALEKQRRRGHP